MAERGIEVAHTTIMRWVQRYIPEFEKRWHRYARPVGASWRIDETYIKIKGKWVYLYRGVDKEGQTIDFFLSEHRDMAAAKQFLQQASEKRGYPQKITLDGYAASREAVGELQKEGVLPAELTVRTSKYLNNLIEIVFTQMTKPDLLATRMGRKYVADFHFSVGDEYAVNQ